MNTQRSMPTDDPAACTDWCLARARELGFAAAGVCDASPSRRSRELRAWLDEGRHGPMEWMRSYVDVRIDPARIVPGTQSVLVVAARYHDGRPDARNFATGSSGSTAYGRVARYARGADYHRVMKRRLRILQQEFEAALPGTRGKVCCDIEPVPERELAERAGIGRIGKNTLLITDGLGSWTVLASYFTTARLQPTIQVDARDPCGTCTRCIDACPTSAISPWRVDASRCITTVTIEQRSLPDNDIASRTGDWLFGCDICQEVCPHNQPTRQSRRQGIDPSWDGRNASFSLRDVLRWNQSSRRAAMGTSALARVNAPAARRNAVWCALDVLRHDPQHPLRSDLESICADESDEPQVRHAAQAVLGMIG
jgi:epoxyqueuosine reductase